MSRGKAWAGRRGIALGAVVVTMLAAGQAGTLIARADAPVIPEPDVSSDVPVPDVTVAEANDPSDAVLEGG
ncbi:MAG TPA: hypothetical protein VE522_03495, partial [Actinomycetota bacterium]|nr:hypothetical protein [Actinomycetota bacterium]